ncbi:hypothetical protein BJ170DRAFT_732914 [Xylariales sp. AK1849]|nr:hypothetical protein BJ170DRAFT_732914 [Xylariales sp. AK1849]
MKLYSLFVLPAALVFDAAIASRCKPHTISSSTASTSSSVISPSTLSTSSPPTSSYASSSTSSLTSSRDESYSTSSSISSMNSASISSTDSSTSVSSTTTSQPQSSSTTSSSMTTSSLASSTTSSTSSNICSATPLAAEGRPELSSRLSDCSNLNTVTVTPPAVTTTDISFTTTDILTGTTTITTTSPSPAAFTKRDGVTMTGDDGTVTVSPTEIPAYATYCDEPAEYYSACSEAGITAVTTTAPVPTVTSTTTIYWDTLSDYAGPSYCYCYRRLKLIGDN